MRSEPTRSRAFKALEPELKEPVQRLYHAQQQQRWRLVLLLWWGGVPLSLWGLRQTLALLWEYFTWSALRYGLIYHPISALGLLVTVLLTLTSAFAELGFRRWGYSGQEVRRLKRQVERIRAKGEKHPLWAKVWGDDSSVLGAEDRD
ncbi:MAG: hypothetical protein HC771_14160 [Synechococcales cyanobacterium CRU_2_2]|nr:hypothetical protein [Synechococcales cyanobacterium CRU_2_2]